ncbi:uncharacterized protein [Scyliorhinus torazame]|uniref:uncharacterized protein isoform X7 n=1 Tax=Scyliorhinus torazame TaxID=75743 RepID=UPI003B59DFBC
MAPSSSGLLTLVASCLLLWRCSAARKTMVVLHHNISNEGQQPPPVAPQAVCPELCRCYINILSCHPAGKPVGSHSHDAATGLLEPGPTDDSGKSPHSKNHNTTAEEGTDILTEVPQGIRGTMSGNVLTPFSVLDLSNNNILILGPGAFSQLSSLHFLNVSDNYLSLIGNGAFDHLSSIIYLDLRATSISLDILKGILESTINIVNLYISHTLKCCLCKYPHLDKLILARDVEINCKNIFCTISLMQCYTKEVKKQTILKDKERIIEEMEAVKASAITSLSGERNGDGPQNIGAKLERSRHPEPRIMSAARVQPELGLEILNKDLQLGDKQAELKEEIFNKNLEIKNKIKNEESTRDAERERLKQYNIAKLSSASQRPKLPASGREENTLGRLHKLKEALKSLYHYASHRIANRDDNQFTVKLES